MNPIISAIIATVITLSGGWTIDGMDGAVTLDDGRGSALINIPAECARYVYDAGYDNMRDAVRNLSATPEYKELCF